MPKDELFGPSKTAEFKPPIENPGEPAEGADQEQELKRQIEELNAEIQEAQSVPMSERGPQDHKKIAALTEKKYELEARLPKPKKETRGGQENKGEDDKRKLLEELVKTQAIKKASNVLGVLESSTEDEVEKAWKKLAVKYHPQKNIGDDEAKKNFEQVQSAYALLTEKDESKKLKLAKDFLLEIAKK